jgi:hypothetical protein
MSPSLNSVHLQIRARDVALRRARVVRALARHHATVGRVGHDLDGEAPLRQAAKVHGAVMRDRLIVRTRLPLRYTRALTQVTPGSLRMRIVNLRSAYAASRRRQLARLGRRDRLARGCGGRPGGLVPAGASTVVTRAMRSIPRSVNHRLPSGPAAISNGAALRLIPAVYSVGVPAGVARRGTPARSIMGRRERVRSLRGAPGYAARVARRGRAARSGQSRRAGIGSTARA